MTGYLRDRRQGQDRHDAEDPAQHRQQPRGQRAEHDLQRGDLGDQHRQLAPGPLRAEVPAVAAGAASSTIANSARTIATKNPSPDRAIARDAFRSGRDTESPPDHRQAAQAGHPPRRTPRVEPPLPRHPTPFPPEDRPKPSRPIRHSFPIKLILETIANIPTESPLSRRCNSPGDQSTQ